MSVLELRLSGPLALLPDHAGGLPCVFAEPAAHEPGVWIWTFLYNQSDRLHRVAAAHDSIAAAQARAVSDLLTGGGVIHDAAARASGRLEIRHDSHTPFASLPADTDNWFAELRDIRVFAATVAGDDALRERIAHGISRHVHQLGGKALEWFATPAPPAPEEARQTVRFYRPVHMASMPDEIRV